MQSIKKSAVKISIGIAASVLFTPCSWAVSLVVGHEQPLAVQSTTTAPSGLVYQSTGASTSTLTAYTDGFLFCSNIGTIGFPEVTLAPSHEDQAFTPAHVWAFPTAQDLHAAAFLGPSVVINAGAELLSGLTCHSVGPQGEVASALTQGIFRNGLESATNANYANLINWQVPEGWDWLNADWSQVPVAPCDPTVAQPAQVDEAVSCAAATAVEPGVQGAEQRASTVWTASDGITFTYLLRVDDRFGPQVQGIGPQAGIPEQPSPDDQTSSTVTVVDAYDSTFLSQSNGFFCLLVAMPTQVNSSTCADAGSNTYPLDGPNGTLNFSFTAYPPPIGNGTAYFYIVVVRQIGAGSHPNLTTPVVGAAVTVDPALVAEGGDDFKGDDVIFGFMPSASAGFPWMTGGP